MDLVGICIVGCFGWWFIKGRSIRLIGLVIWWSRREIGRIVGLENGFQSIHVHICMYSEDSKHILNFRLKFSTSI